MLNRSHLLAASNISKALVRFHSHGGIPGENLPFGLRNRYRLTSLFATYIILGFGSPFLIVRHQMLKS